MHSQEARNYDYYDHDADDVENVHCVLRLTYVMATLTRKHALIDRPSLYKIAQALRVLSGPRCGYNTSSTNYHFTLELLFARPSSVSIKSLTKHTQRVSRTCERVGLLEDSWRQVGVVVDLTTRFARGIPAEEWQITSAKIKIIAGCGTKTSG
jgi:hypothetical protein